MNYHTKESLIAFETGIRALFDDGELPFLLHLAGGNEEQLVEIFSEIKACDWVFSGHRAHYHALLSGIPAEQVERMIFEGRSMFIFDRTRNFATSAILGGMCGVAAGVALAVKQAGSAERVWCFLGDGAEEEGHFYEAALFVEAHNLPCMFIVEDNQRQVDTPKHVRRGESECTQRPLGHFKCVYSYFYEPTFPHAGRGAGPTITFKPEAIARHRRASDLDEST